MMQLFKLLLAALSFIALAYALPIQTSGSENLALRDTQIDARSNAFGLAKSEDLLARAFVEEDSGLEARDNCLICLEANAKYTNCPNGKDHPGHAECLMKWTQAQKDAGNPLTCPACRAQISPLITVVKKTPKPATKGKRDLEEIESEMEIEMRDSESTIEERSFDDEDFDLEVRDDCIICLEANAKHTNCPNGASHPAHATCLMQWAQSQANAGQPLTCPACRAQISPLIKVVKKAPQSPTGGRH